MLAEVARRAASAEAPARVHVLGPSAAPLFRLRERFRFRIMLRSADRAALRRTLLAVERARANVARTTRTGIDVDPVQLL